jgi:hypothetical protein
MFKHVLPIELDLPEDILSLDEARAVAKEMGLTFDEWVSRCLVEHTRLTVMSLNDPTEQAFFAAGPSQNFCSA